MIPLGFIRSGAATATVKAATFDGTSKAVWDSMLGTTNSSKLIQAGCFRLPSDFTASVDQPIFMGDYTFQIGLEVLAASNEIQYHLQGNSNPLWPTPVKFNFNKTTDLEKNVYFLLSVRLTGYNVPTVAYLYVKIGAQDMHAFETPPVDYYANSSIRNVGFVQMGGHPATSTKTKCKIGPFWSYHYDGGTNYFDGTDTEVWQDFWGAGSHLAATECVPQFVTADGAFTGGTTATTYPAPQWLIDWTSLVNKGSNGQTATETGTPVYGNW